MNKRNLDFGNVFKNVVKIILILVQLLLMVALLLGIYGFTFYIFWVVELLALMLVFNIIYNPGKMSIKLSWVLFVMILPICGIMFYLFWGRTSLSKKTLRTVNRIDKRTADYIKQDNKILGEIEDYQAINQIKAVNNTSSFAVYKNTRTNYFPLGEDMFKSLKDELAKAKKFIFIEFFIISKGRMHDEIFEILVKKAKEGLEIKIIYDQAGSLMVAPKNYVAICKENGIGCAAFNPLSLSLVKYINYRDHRKIVVIDGNVGYTGGINIGDEYINDYPKYGHWKDVGVLLRGDAVWSLTVIFLRMWDFLNKSETEFDDYRTTINYLEEKGYVMPFSDGPTNQDNPAEINYKRMISTAQKYVYITTPYLIIDSDMMSCLTLAAQSGVDVRIITPFIPDKALIHAETRSFYPELLAEGVKIHEYKPGFIHAKSLVTDDKMCFIGTVNFDYRSLIWNYECGVWIYNNQTVLDVKDDFLETIEKSVEITYQKMARESIFKKSWHAFLRIISPLV